MSEYQYYEFLAIDRLLETHEQAAVLGGNVGCGQSTQTDTSVPPL